MKHAWALGRYYPSILIKPVWERLSTVTRLSWCPDLLSAMRLALTRGVQRRPIKPDH